ncbi:acyltransferase [Cupriavidus taiwanensis]|uniref:acyltransferase family protein n=1 Tax=Cupriavidus taiwanensis TaxID=164546 RepID=UPI002542394B|nr:acyltransferase [Cupriavidus taiwanensis]MDK3025591.1 acyltransferase [Cupriavidus taiwanensis]
MNRNSNLDGVRGLAALAVVLGHSNTLGTGMAPLSMRASDFASETGNDIAARLWHTVFNADAAVMLFFVLSGYVLTAGLNATSRRPLQELPAYSIRRLFRIYPVAIVAAIPLAILYPLDWQTTVGTMLLTDTSANGVLWTLQIELLGSALVFALWAVRRRMLGLVLLVLFPLVAREFAGTPYVYYFACMPAFLLGALLPHVPRVFWSSRFLLLASLLTLIGADLFMAKMLHWRYLATFAAVGVVGCLTVQSFRVLDSRPVQFLGRICFPMYVLHMASVLAAQPFINQYLPGASMLRTVAFATVTGVPTILAAALVHRWIEAPAISAGSKLAKRIAGVSTKTAVEPAIS